MAEARQFEIDLVVAVAVLSGMPWRANELLATRWSNDVDAMRSVFCAYGSVRGCSWSRRSS